MQHYLFTILLFINYFFIRVVPRNYSLVTVLYVWQLNIYHRRMKSLRALRWIINSRAFRGSWRRIYDVPFRTGHVASQKYIHTLNPELGGIGWKPEKVHCPNCARNKIYTANIDHPTALNRTFNSTGLSEEKKWMYSEKLFCEFAQWQF